jgi:hypothetical protein
MVLRFPELGHFATQNQIIQICVLVLSIQGNKTKYTKFTWQELVSRVSHFCVLGVHTLQVDHVACYVRVPSGRRSALRPHVQLDRKAFGSCLFCGLRLLGA